MYDLKERVNYYWNLACKFDGIDTRELFVIFSYSNPYVHTYSMLVRQMLRREQ